MSALRCNRRTRDAIHGELTALLAPGGPLSVPPSGVTDFLNDDLLADVAAEYRARTPDAPSDGAAAIITAGPPGAGKSTAVDDLIDRHRRIDPDEIKEILLGRLEEEGMLDLRHGHVLRDGKPVTPGELSWWVHQASTATSNVVRLISLREGENFVMEGTLSWEALPHDYALELAQYDYEQLVVLDVEVPRSVAIEQARTRWWDGRCDGSPLGGRFMPDSAFDLFYPDTSLVSVCAQRARDLYRSALDVGLEAEMACVTRDRAGAEMTAVLTAAGLEEWPVAGPRRRAAVGVPCLRCGRPLRSAESIALGLGPTCKAV